MIRHLHVRIRRVVVSFVFGGDPGSAPHGEVEDKAENSRQGGTDKGRPVKQKGR